MHYHWASPDSLLKDVEFYKPHKKEEAVIFAPEGIASERLADIPDLFRRRGMSAESDMQDGAYVLRIKNFNRRSAVLGVLNDAQLVSGASTQQATNYDKKQPFHFSTVRLAGGIHFVTDVATMIAGAMRGKKYGGSEIIAAFKWASVNLMLATLGTKDPDKQMGYIFKDLRRSLEKSGIPLDAEDKETLARLGEKDGVFPTLERFVRENPIIISNVVTASGGVNMLQAGLAQRTPKGDPNYDKVIAGGLTAVGQMTGILIEPKKKLVLPEVPADQSEDKQRPDGVFSRIVEWYHERPLRITGHMSMLSNVFRIRSGIREVGRNNEYLHKGGYEHEKQLLQNEIHELGLKRSVDDLLGASLAAGSIDKDYGSVVEKVHKLNQKHQMIMDASKAKSAYVDSTANVAKIVANCIYGMSSTNIDADLKSKGMLSEIGNTVAHFIARQPENEREGLVFSMSSMLAQMKGISSSEKEIGDIINAKLTAIQSNPWERGAKPTTQIQSVAKHTAPDAAAITDIRV
ncbi:MAG: hypothetical protein U1E36_03000 [Rickettsiales bacterium]